MSWIEGEPKDDGLFLCAFRDVSGAAIWVELPNRFYAIGQYLEKSGTACPYKPIRHYRLPAPQPPLKPPRMFRAKHDGELCFGVKSSIGERYFIWNSEYPYAVNESELTDLKWLDQE